MSEFTPSLRLLAAFAIHPELFYLFREANFEYWRSEDTSVYENKLFGRISGFRDAICSLFPGIRDELRALEKVWDGVDADNRKLWEEAEPLSLDL